MPPETLSSEQRDECPHDVNELLRTERQFCKWNERAGFVWCQECRVWIRFVWEKKRA